MNARDTGLPVRDIRGRRVGTLSAQYSCCIRLHDGRAIRRDALLSVDQLGAELICDGDQLARFACPLHGGSA